METTYREPRYVAHVNPVSVKVQRKSGQSEQNTDCHDAHIIINMNAPQVHLIGHNYKCIQKKHTFCLTVSFASLTCML